MKAQICQTYDLVEKDQSANTPAIKVSQDNLMENRCCDCISTTANQSSVTMDCLLCRSVTPGAALKTWRLATLGCLLSHRDRPSVQVQPNPKPRSLKTNRGKGTELSAYSFQQQCRNFHFSCETSCWQKQVHFLKHCHLRYFKNP